LTQAPCCGSCSNPGAEEAQIVAQEVTNGAERHDDADRVALETSSPSSPGVIKPVGSDEYVHVVMPMFVQW